jgi:CheY-like chemotaxis protein
MLDINRTVKDMERMLRRLIGEGIELITALTSDSETVHMDPSQLEQIVMNLVINASDAMPSGGKIAIKVSREEVDDKRARGFPELEPGRYAKLVVADSGCGMDQETVSRIFEPFFTTKEIGKGTGLGLSSVFGIVQNANGHIAVESAPDEGAVFTIFLPRCEAGVELARADSLREELSRGTEVVLLVEDDDVVRAFVAEVLEIYGYNVVAARSSGEALLIAERDGRSIDLLLTDLVMPYMSGAELAERVKKHHPAIRVLFMSGYAAAAVPGDSSLDDRTYRLQKPFTPKELSCRVREILDAPPFDRSVQDGKFKRRTRS